MANFTNLNLCFSVTDTFDGVPRPLSSYSCSEVYILNQDNKNLIIFDEQSCTDGNPYLSGNNYYVIHPGYDVTMRGLTNSNQLSCMAVSGSAVLSYRTQFFSSFPLTVY